MRPDMLVETEMVMGNNAQISSQLIRVGYLKGIWICVSLKNAAGNN